MIIYDDHPNQGFFIGMAGGGREGGKAGVQGKKRGWRGI